MRRSATHRTCGGHLFAGRAPHGAPVVAPLGAIGLMAAGADACECASRLRAPAAGAIEQPPPVLRRGARCWAAAAGARRPLASLRAAVRRSVPVAARWHAGAVLARRGGSAWSWRMPRPTPSPQLRRPRAARGADTVRLVRAHAQMREPGRACTSCAFACGLSRQSGALVPASALCVLVPVLSGTADVSEQSTACVSARLRACVCMLCGLFDMLALPPLSSGSAMRFPGADAGPGWRQPSSVLSGRRAPAALHRRLDRQSAQARCPSCTADASPATSPQMLVLLRNRVSRVKAHQPLRPWFLGCSPRVPLSGGNRDKKRVCNASFACAAEASRSFALAPLPYSSQQMVNCCTSPTHQPT